MKIGRSRGQHLDAHQLIDHTAACPVCGSSASRSRVLLVQPGPDVYLLRCPDCRACSASHMPTREVLAEYYRDYYRFRAKEHEVTFAQPGRFARHVRRWIPRDGFGVRVRILDFGGGDGTLSMALGGLLLREQPERRIEITLIDFSRPILVDDPRINLTPRHPDLPVEGTFDLILASGVLEHIPEVRSVITALYSALAPGAFFYARTPYALPFARLFTTLDLTYPAHVHDMGSPFWDRFTTTFGWEARTVRSSPSAVESRFRDDPLRTLAAMAFKLPAHLENRLSPVARAGRLWHLVGGWEVLLQKNEARQRRAS